MVPRSQLLVVLTLSLCLSIQEGFGHPLSGQTEFKSQLTPRHLRVKRCSCNNQMDSECHYFCHLDIIWVNTPSKMTVYGLGSPLSRRRRSVERCTCDSPSDQTCISFCRRSSENASPMQPKPSTLTQGFVSGGAGTSLLASLRNVARANAQLAWWGVSPKKKSQVAHRSQNR